MIERDKDDDIFEVYCDFCSAHESIDAEHGWQWMINILKAKGWMSYKKGDEWKHHCGECVNSHKPW